MRLHVVEITTKVEGNIRWHIVKGVININELTEYLKKIYSSQDFDSNMNVFWNLYGADFSLVTAEDIFHFKDYVGAHWGKEGKSKAALVVPNEIGYGMSRIYEIMMESDFPSSIEVFKDIVKAREWIEAD